MIAFYPPFVSERQSAELTDVADHIDYVKGLVGTDHVGLGSDFDGIPTVVRGLEDVSTFPDLLAELARRGWSEAELRKVAGENILRAMREAELVARRLQ
jgi:membrane dipeptidase